MYNFRNCTDPVRVPVRPVASSNPQVAKDRQAHAKVEVIKTVVDDTPSTPVIPTPAPLTQYPPPPKFSFGHFYATGQSFARHNFNEPWQSSPVLRTYPRCDSLYTKAKVPTDVVTCASTQDDRISNKKTSSGPEYTQVTVKNSIVPVMDVVVAMPDHKAVEQPLQLASAPIHTTVAPAITKSPGIGVIQGPVAPAPGPKIIQAPSTPTSHPEITQVGLPTIAPSIVDRQTDMLDHVAAQEFKIKNEMEALFVAFATNGAYDVPALLILSMMEEAKTRPLPLFPNSLTELNPDQLI